MKSVTCWIDWKHVMAETLELDPSHRNIVLEILTRHVPGREVWAFGSRVNGRARRFSDLDLTILGDVPLTLAQRAALAHDFDESLLPFKVDVGDWCTTDEAFREIVRREHVVLVPATGSASSPV